MCMVYVVKCHVCCRKLNDNALTINVDLRRLSSRQLSRVESIKKIILQTSRVGYYQVCIQYGRSQDYHLDVAALRYDTTCYHIAMLPKKLS